MGELELDETNRAKLDGIVKQMSDNKESDEDIQFVVDDFKKKYGSSPKSTAPSKTGGESGAQNTPYSSSESALKSWTTEANPLANKGVQVPLAKPIDGVEQTKIAKYEPNNFGEILKKAKIGVINPDLDEVVNQSKPMNVGGVEVSVKGGEAPPMALNVPKKEVDQDIDLLVKRTNVVRKLREQEIDKAKQFRLGLEQLKQEGADLNEQYKANPTPELEAQLNQTVKDLQDTEKAYNRAAFAQSIYENRILQTSDSIKKLANDKVPDNFFSGFYSGMKDNLESRGKAYDLATMGKAEQIQYAKDQALKAPSIRAGDRVQWVEEGDDRFDEPKKIQRFSDDGKSAFFFVDGQEIEVPTKELEKPTSLMAEGGQMLGGVAPDIIEAIGWSLAGLPFIGAASVAARQGAQQATEDFSRVFNEVKSKGLPSGKKDINGKDIMREATDDEAYDIAIRAAGMGAATGAAEGLVGTLGGGKIVKAVANKARTQGGKIIAEKALDTASDAAIAGGMQVTRNAFDQYQGIDTKITEGVGETMLGEALLSAPINTFSGVGEYSKAKKETAVREVFKAINESKSNPYELQKLQSNLDVLKSQKLISDIDYNELNKKAEDYIRVVETIPTEVSDKQKAADLIIERDELEAKKESVDKAFQKPIDEKINAINDELVVMATPIELQKNTSQTDEKYGTINRNDGKGVVDLTKEEYLKEEGSTALSDEARLKRRKENEDILYANESTFYNDVDLKNAKIGDEIHYEENKDGNFINHKTKVKDIVDGKVIFENGQTEKNVSSYMNVTAEDAWFAKNKPKATPEAEAGVTINTETDGKERREEEAKVNVLTPTEEVKGVVEAAPLKEVESRKQSQLEIIKKENPAPNDYNTWVRDVKDIKTAEEAFAIAKEDGAMYPDFTEMDMQNALEDGEVIVYSSYPIKDGVFITPSKMEAQNYAGGKDAKLYSKKVKLNDVAWIDEGQGQYAPVKAVEELLGQKESTSVQPKIDQTNESNIQQSMDKVSSNDGAVGDIAKEDNAYQESRQITENVSRENPDASILITPKGNDLNLTALYVGKENRGKGIGSKVLESVKKQADKVGKKVVLDATNELDEETDLERLGKFYEANGFTKVGDNKFEYNPNKGDIAKKGEAVSKEETPALRDVESTAKALDDIDKNDLEFISRKENNRRKGGFYEKAKGILFKGFGGNASIIADKFGSKYKYFTNNPDYAKSFSLEKEYLTQKGKVEKYKTNYKKEFNTTENDYNNEVLKHSGKKNINDLTSKDFDNFNDRLKADGYDVVIIKRVEPLIPSESYRGHSVDIRNVEVEEHLILNNNAIKKIADQPSLLENNAKSISEAYHKAKADGSNPELVKAVESLLSKEQAPTAKEFTSEEDKKIKDIAIEANTKVGSYVKSVPTGKKDRFANNINEFEATNPFTNEKKTFKKQSEATEYVINEIAKANTKKGREEIFQSLLSKEQTPQPKNETKENEAVLKDDNGSPLIAYHGTSKGIKAADLKQSGQAGDYGEGIYFATDKREAQQRNSENIIEANIESPKHLVIGSKEYFDGIYKELGEKFGSVIPQYQIGLAARKAGYTSMEVERPEGKWIIVFDGAKIKEAKQPKNETKNTAITADAGQVQPPNVDSEVAKDDTKGEVGKVELKEKTPVLNGSEKSLLKKFLKFIEQRQGERTYQNMSVQKFKDAYNALPKSVKDFISSDLNGKIRAYEGGISDSETPSFSNQFMPQLFGTKKVYGEDVETTEGTIDTKKISLLSKENNVNNNIKTDEGEVIAISPKFKKGAENRKGALSDFEDAILNLDESIGDNDIRNKDIMKKRRELSNLLNDRNFYNDLAKSDNLQEILDKYNIKTSTEKKTLDGEVKENVKEKAAKGFISVALNKLTKSLKDFQGRGKEYSQQTYDRIINEAKSGALNISSIPPIQIWKDKSGNWVILGGHSRTKAFEDLAAGKHELNPKYKKSDFANISAQIVEANTLEEAQKIAQESNQGAVQTVVDNAKYVREKLLPTFKSFNEAKTKLKDLYGAAWTRIYAYANLNPNGKAMTFLKAFSENLESESTDISRKMAEWTGKAMTDFKGLTNEHENEIFEYLLENNKIKTYNEFYDILNRRINGIDGFVASEPLNFGAKVGRGSNEAAVIKEIQEAKAEKKRVEDEIKKVQKTETDKNKRDKTISELTKEAIRLNTLIGDLEKKQAQAKEGDALQFNLFNDLNEQIENGNINAEQAEQFLDGTNEVEPIVASIESKAAGANEAELNEAIQEADNLINEVKQEKELNKPKSAKEKLDEKLREIDKKYEQKKLEDLMLRKPKQNAILSTEGIAYAVEKVMAYIEYGGLSAKEAIDKVAEFFSEKGIELDSEDIASIDNIVNQPSGEKPKKKKKKRKSLLNRVSEEKVLAAVQKYGMFYETENQAQAKIDAKDFVRDIGDDAALDAVRKNFVEGGRAAFVYAEVIDNLMIDMANAKNTKESEALLARQAELLDEFDRRARAGGQFNAALANVYATSDFNYKLTKQIEKYKNINNGVISDEVKAKFEELEAQFKEVNEKLKEAEKRAKEAEEKAAIENIKEDVNRGKDKETYSQKAKKTADKFRAKFKTKPKFYDENGNEIEVFTAGFTWNDLVELAAKAIEKTGNVADGLKAVSEFVQESDVYKKLTKKGQTAFDKQINDYFSEDKTQGRVKVPHSLIRRLVEEGNTDMDSLVAAVKKEIAEEYPDATDREIRDAITGYGKTVNQNQEEIEKTIRALKFIGKSQSILEDIAMKKRPLKSGAQRDKLTVDERKLLKEIKEAMKDLPVDLETQDAQLKTALDAAKTRLRNRIEDLNKEIETGEVAKKNNKPTITDQEYKDLVEQRDLLQYQHDLMFKGKPQTVGEKKIKSLEKQLDDLLTKEIKGQEKSVVFSESEQKEIDTLKDKINAAREEMGLIAAKPMPKTEMEKAEAKEKAKIEALEKQLEDLRQGIIESKKDKTKVQESQEVKDLKAQIQKEKEFLGLIPAKPTETQLMEMVYDRAIEDINDKIKNNDLAFKKPENKEFIPELEAKKQRLNEAKEELKKLREEAGIIEARRLENAKNSVKRRIAELERRIIEKDFSKKKPTPLIKDNELIKLNAQKLRIKDEFDKLQYQNELNQRNKVQKFYDSALEIWGLPRALLATGEFSFVLIQGGLYTLSNMRMAKSAFDIGMKSLVNENRAKQFLKHLQAQDFYPIMKASKLALTEPDAKLEAREEQFLGGWVNYIWDVAGYPTKLGGEKLYEGWKKLNPIRAVERAGVSYLNMLRVQKFLEGQEMLLAQGKTFETHPKDYKNLADVINTFTGRASLGKGQQFAKELSAVFFSPRNWASMVKQATPYALYHFGKMGSREEGQSSLSLLRQGKVKPSVAQKMAIKDYTKFVALTAGIVAMAAVYLNGDDDDETEVVLDPTSSDFMKIKLGNTRVDPWGGRIQQVILTNRIINSLTGGDGQSLDYAWKMIQNKFNPSASMVNKYVRAKRLEDGETYVDQFGKPISIQEDLRNSLLPIYWQSFSEVNKENPALKAGMIHAYALFGGGSQTYKTPTEIMKAKGVSYEDLENTDVVAFKDKITKNVVDKFSQADIDELTATYAKEIKDLNRQVEKGLIKETKTQKALIEKAVVDKYKTDLKTVTSEEKLEKALGELKTTAEKANKLKTEFARYSEGQKKWIAVKSISAQENKIKKLIKKGIIDKAVEREVYRLMVDINADNKE
jgi:GNAT superfamily N-acetyltransferase